MINVTVKYDGRKGWESLVEELRTCGGEGFSGQLKPAEAARKLKKARADGEELSNLTQQKTDALFLESRLSSLTSTVSQLRCWKDYATGVLLYKDDCTLPPRSTQHVLMWINIFRNGKMAGIYVGSLRWACEMRDLSDDWDQPIVNQVVRACKKLTLRLLGAKLDLRKVLSENMVERLVILSDSLCTVEWSDFLLTGWEFLMRIQSECLPLECGEPSEHQVLDPARHSAVFHDARGFEQLRL